MLSDGMLNQIITDTAQEYVRIFGAKLKTVYLYGSYARGDFDEESDIDIVGIVDLDDIKLNVLENQLGRYISQLGLEHDVLISATTIPEKRFIEYQDILPYYANIINEGVILSA